MATTTASTPSRFRLQLPEALSVLAVRDFRVFWIGEAISMTGTWMQFVAQGLLVLQLWDSAFALGALNFANAIPSLCVMLFGGVLADRADKRLILLVTQSVMLLLAAVIGLLVLAGAVQYWMLLVATVGLGVAFGYDMPAFQALMPELVPPEKISQVIGINSSTFHGTRMIGPAVAGALIGVFGLATAYFLNAASFVAVILALTMIRYRAPARRAGPATSAIEGLREGLRHASRRRNLQALLLLTALNCIFLFPVAAVLTPFYAKNVLHAGPGVLGLMFTAGGFGSMLGAMALIWWSERWRVERIWLAVIIAPVGLAIQALTRDPAVAIVVQAFVSFAFSSQLGLIQTMIQESTPRDYRGRVMSLHGIAFNGTVPLAAIAISAAAVVFGLPSVMLALAATFFVLGMCVLRFSGGGIRQVARDSWAEYHAVSAEDMRAAVEAGLGG
jgi:MFS family permease